MRERLLREQGHLLEAVREPIEPHSLELSDSAADEFGRDMALSAVSAGGNALLEVNEALGRICAGTYGICQETARRIPLARLKAVPWARFAREVEERLEATGQLLRAHLDQAQSLRGPAPGGLVAAVQGNTEETSTDEAPAEDETLHPQPIPRPAPRPRPASAVRTQPRPGDRSAKQS